MNELQARLDIHVREGDVIRILQRCLHIQSQEASSNMHLQAHSSSRRVYAGDTSDPSCDCACKVEVIE